MRAATPVNPPVVRASTVLFDSTAHQREMRQRAATSACSPTGRAATRPTTRWKTWSANSKARTARGCSPRAGRHRMTLLAYLKPGDHVLMSDSVYEPARKLVRFLPHALQHPLHLLCGRRQRRGSKNRSRHAHGLRRMPGLAGV
jgi:cystathionine beta-lyase/cystathionine gamma-synthase